MFICRLMDQFSRVFETPYDNTDINAFNCNVDRIAQVYNPDDLMYVMNHFMYANIDLGSIKVQVPLKSKALITNGWESITSHANNCTSTFNRKPNFIEVDFYTIGDALNVVAEMNGVPPVPLLSSKISAASHNASSSQQVVSRTDLSPTDHVLIDNTINSSGIRSNYKSGLPAILILTIVATLLT